MVNSRSNICKAVFEENLFSIFKNKIKLLSSGLDIRNSAIVGASAFAWNELDK